MAINVLPIVLCSITLAALPCFSLGGLRFWLCGTCTVCRSCPPCEPHLNISPKCECQEKFNNYNCNCITQKNLKEYHRQWNFHIMANQQNNHAAQMNSHQVKRHLLLWLIGLSFFNIFMLVVVILLVAFAPALLHRCAVWKSKFQLKRRNHIMKKVNLVEASPHSDVEMQSPLPLFSVSSVVPTSVPTLKPSYDDLFQQLEVDKKLVIKLTRDLEA